MVLCKNCKHSIEWIDESSIIPVIYLCDLDYFACDEKDDLPCDFYVPLDVNNSESKRDQA